MSTRIPTANCRWSGKLSGYLSARAEWRAHVTVSHATGRQIAEHLVAADKDPAVAGRVALVPFDAVIGNRMRVPLGICARPSGTGAW